MTVIGLMVLVDFIYILAWNKVQKISSVRQFLYRWVKILALALSSAQDIQPVEFYIKNYG